LAFVFKIIFSVFLSFHEIVFSFWRISYLQNYIFIQYLQIHYYLDEKNKWGMSVPELNRALNASRELCDPRVIVVINPGNPTGQVLSRENIVDVIKFAYDNRLFLFADEVRVWGHLFIYFECSILSIDDNHVLDTYTFQEIVVFLCRTVVTFRLVDILIYTL
jgi:hypothetical protein